MLGKSTVLVSCLLASTGNAVLNADSVNAYQKHLVDSKRHTSNQAEKPPVPKSGKCEPFKEEKTVYMMCEMLEKRDADKAAAKQKKKDE